MIQVPILYRGFFFLVFVGVFRYYINQSERIISLKKFIVFCLITLFPYVAVYGDWTGGDWYFDSEEKCQKSCATECMEARYVEGIGCMFEADLRGSVCPVGWYYHTVQIPNPSDNSEYVTVGECLRGADDYYTGHTETIDYNETPGHYRLTTTITYNTSACNVVSQSKYINCDDLDKWWYCSNLKWWSRWPDYTDADNSNCNSYTYNLEVIKCHAGYYYDNTGWCLSCGSETIGNDTYQLTSDDENKSSKNYACYVADTYTDERGTYTLKSTSGDKCTYQMLTDQ